MNHPISDSRFPISDFNRQPAVGNRQRPIALVLALLASVLAAASAGPIGEQVVRGEVAFQRQDGLTTITASNNSIIRYQSFNIGSAETVRFIQPHAAARVLNRILSPAPTTIDGQLLANGHIYLVNPAGIIFGQNAFVNVGGIHAAAANLSDSDFLAGIDHYTDAAGAVVNQGTIIGNSVALIGNRVANYGTITAERGTLVMAAGDDVYIGKRDGRIFVKIEGAAGGASSEAPAVENAGTVNAEGGTAVLGAGDAYSLAIRTTGVVKGADVTVEGQGTGAVEVTGTIGASNPGGKGGSVKLLGQYVGLVGATVDASGATGGGEILVGGNYQGSGPERNSLFTYVGAGSVLRADATLSGNGGRVIVWSDGATGFYGSLSARGGALSGNGGFAEVSGKGYLEFMGTADLRAPAGFTGTLLLDPTDFTIGLPPDSPTLVFTPPPGIVITDPVTPSNISVNTLAGLLTGSDVTLITVPGGGGLGIITVVAALDPVAGYFSPFRLTLNAANSIAVNAPILEGGMGGSLTMIAPTVAINAPVLLNAPAGGFAVTTDNFTAAAPVTAPGGIAIAPFTPGLAFTLNGVGPPPPGDLSTVTLNSLLTVGNTLTIGDATTGLITVNAGNHSSQDWGGLTLQGAGVTVTGALTLPGPPIVSACNVFVDVGTNTFTNAAGATINAGAGTFTLRADDASIGAAITANGGITIYTATNNRDIDLSSGGGGTLSLDATELGFLSSTTGVTIGLAANTSQIDIGQTNPGTLPLNLGYNLTLIGDDYDQSGNTVSVGLNALTLQVDTITSLSTPLTANGGLTVKPLTTAPAVAVAVGDNAAGSLVIGQTELGNLVSSTGITLGSSAAGNLDVRDTNPGGLTFSYPTSLASGGTVTVRSKITTSSNLSITATGDININAAIDPPPSVLMDSNDDINIAASVNADNLIQLRGGRDGTGSVNINVGGSLSTNNPGSDIWLEASITPGGTGGNIALGGGNVAAVDLLTAIAHVGNINRTAGNVTASRAYLNGATGISISTLDVATLDAVTNGAAASTINLTDTAGGLTVRDTAGMNLGVNAGAANVTLTVQGGSLAGASADGATADIVGGTVTLSVTDPGSVPPHSTIGTGAANRLQLNAVTLNASTTGDASDHIWVLDTAGGLAAGTINANLANVDLSVAGGSLSSATVDGTADIVGATVTLAVTGAGSTMGASAANPLELDAVTLNATTSGGAADHVFVLDTAGGLAAALVNAALGNVNITVQNGSLTSAVVDGIPDIVGNTVTLAVTGAGNTIGLNVGNPLEINAVTLNATTNGAVNDDIFVLDTAGGLAAGTINANLANVDLSVAGGSLSSATVDTLADITGATLTLAVTGAGSTIGLNVGNPLEINATTLNATTNGAAGDDIFVLDTAGGLAAGLVTAALGNVNITVQNGSLTSAVVDGIPDIVGNTVTLAVTGAGNTIGASAANPLEIDAAALYATTAFTPADHIWILDTAGGLMAGAPAGPPGGVNAGLGDVTLTVNGGSLTSGWVDFAPDVVGNNLTLAVTGNGSTIGVGPGIPLEIDGTTVTASTTAAVGDAMYIGDTAGGFTVGAAGIATSGGGPIVILTLAAGPITLQGDVNAGAGALTLSAPVIVPNSSTARILTGATVTFNNALNLGSDTTSSGEQLTVNGNLAFGVGASLAAQIGSAAGQVDQLIVNGTVALNGATLNLNLASPGSPPPASSVFTLIVNDLADGIAGQFTDPITAAPIPQWGLIAANGRPFAASYLGGDGNDFTLTSQAATSTWDGGSLLTNNWSDAANWINDVAIAPGDALVFTGNTRLTPNNDFTAGTGFASITIRDTGGGCGNFTLGGNRVILSSTGNAIDVQTGTQTIGTMDLDTGAAQTYNLGGGGALNLNSTIAVTAGNPLTLNTAVAGTAINVNGTVNLNDSLSLTGAGVVTTSSAIEGPGGLTINMPGGTATFNGTVGASTPLASVTVQNSNGVTFNSTFDAGTVALNNTTGTIAFNGATTDVTTGLSAAAQAFNVAFNGATNTIAGSTSFSNTGTVTLGDQGTDTCNFTGGVATNGGPANTNLAGTLTTSNAAINLGATTLTADATLDSGGGSIQIASLTGPHDLTLAAGIAAGTTTFAGAVTNLGDGVGAALTVQNGVTGNVTFQSTVGANSGIRGTAGADMIFRGGVTLANGDTGTNMPSDVWLEGVTFSGFDNLIFGTLIPNTGLVTLNSNGSNIQIGSINGSQNLVLAAGIAGGSVTVTGSVLNLGTGTGPALTVQAGVLGLVRFQGSVNASSGIVAQAATSNLRFDDNVTLADGDTATNLPGAVRLDGLTFSGFDGLTFNALTLSGGPVTLDSNGSAIQIGTLTGAQNLTLAAGIGAGTTTFTGAVTNLGTGTGAALTIENGVTGLVYFQNTVGANSGLVAQDASSNVRFDQDVTLANGDTGTDLPGAAQLDGLTFSGFDNLTFGTVALSTGAVTIASNNSDINLGPVDGMQFFSLNSGAGTTTFNGPVGANIPLGIVATDAGGTTQINGGLVQALSQTYGDPVTLDAAGNSTVLAAFNLSFLSALDGFADGQEALNVSAFGTAYFGGPIGGGQRLASLLINPIGATLIAGGAVTTTGVQAYNNPVTLGANTVLGGSSVLFNSTLDTQFAPVLLAPSPPAPPAPVGPPVGSVDLTVNITPTSPNPWVDLTRLSNVGTTRTLNNLTVNTTRDIELNSTAIWTTGNILFGSNLATVPDVATIYRATAGNVGIATGGGNFTVGDLHKLTVANGSLLINAGAGNITVGDLVASGSISLACNTLTILRREPTPAPGILLSTGQSEADHGTDFVAENGTFVFAVGSIALQAVGSPQYGVMFGSSGTPLNPTLHQITNIPGNTPLPPGTSSAWSGHTLRTLFGPAGQVLDDRPNGYSPNYLAEALATAIPSEPPSRPVTQQVVLSPALRELLEQLGIFARDLTAVEQNLLAVGLPVAYDDTVKTDEPQHSDYTVAAARLPDDLVQETVGTYRRVFEKEGKYQDTEARGLLQKAFDAYKATAKDVDPLAFRAFVERTPDQAAALKLMNELRLLFAQIANLGLTDIQVRNAEQLVVRGITPTGLTPEQLVRAIKGGAGGKGEVASGK